MITEFLETIINEVSGMDFKIEQIELGYEPKRLLINEVNNLIYSHWNELTFFNGIPLKEIEGIEEIGTINFKIKIHR